MSLIDANKEMQMIKKISDEANEKLVKEENKGDSYFLRRNDKRARVLRSIEEYGFQTPMEFQKMLSEMWQELDDEMMQQFVTVCGVAAYKNRMTKVDDGTISSYVYEF